MKFLNWKVSQKLYIFGRQTEELFNSSNVDFVIGLRVTDNRNLENNRKSFCSSFPVCLPHLQSIKCFLISSRATLILNLFDEFT